MFNKADRDSEFSSCIEKRESPHLVSAFQVFQFNYLPFLWESGGSVYPIFH